MKQSNIIILAVACLVVGFVGGVFYASFSSPPSGLEEVSQSPTGMPPGMPPSSSAGKPQQQKAAIDAQIKQWQAKVEAAPDQPDVYVQAGHAMFDIQQYKKAIEYYEKAVELGQGDANLLTDTGVCYRRLDNPKKAVEYFRKARKADPSHKISALNLGIVLYHDLQDRKGAVEAWNEYLKLDPNGKNADIVRQGIARIEAEIAELEGK